MSAYVVIHSIFFRNKQYGPGDILSAPSGRVGGLVKRGVLEIVNVAEERQEPLEKAVKSG